MLPWKHLVTAFNKTVVALFLCQSELVPDPEELLYYFCCVSPPSAGKTQTFIPHFCPRLLMLKNKQNLLILQVVLRIMAVTTQPGSFQPSSFQTSLFDCCDDCGVCEHIFSPPAILSSADCWPLLIRFYLSIRLVHLVVPAVYGLLHRQRHGRVLPVRPGHAHPQCLQDQIQHQSKISIPVWRKKCCYFLKY